jgi:hypothetical protein
LPTTAALPEFAVDVISLVTDTFVVSLIVPDEELLPVRAPVLGFDVVAAGVGGGGVQVVEEPAAITASAGKVLVVRVICAYLLDVGLYTHLEYTQSQWAVSHVYTYGALGVYVLVAGLQV